MAVPSTGERLRFLATRPLFRDLPTTDAFEQRRRGTIAALVERLAARHEAWATLFDILMRSTFVGSQHATQRSLSLHPPALYLTPHLERFRFLDWRSFDAIYEAGYRCAKARLEAGGFPRALWEGRIEDPTPGSW